MLSLCLAFKSIRFDGLASEAFTGPSAGFSVNAPTGNGGNFQINYAYRLTNSAFMGVHTLGVILVL